MNRAGESSSPPVRSPRLYHKDALWFFKTREGFELGPYFSEEEGQEAVADFVYFARDLNPQVIDQYIKYQRGKIRVRLEKGEFPCRKSERAPAPERSSRLFSVGDAWFFKTREGTNIGPYEDEATVDGAAKRFITYAAKLSEKQVKRLIRASLDEIDRLSGWRAGRLARSNDDKPLVKRSRRVVKRPDGWYVRLRGGAQLGPFVSEQMAESESARFTRLVQQIAPDRLDGLLSSVLIPKMSLPTIPIKERN